LSATPDRGLRERLTLAELQQYTTFLKFLLVLFEGLVNVFAIFGIDDEHVIIPPLVNNNLAVSNLRDANVGDFTDFYKLTTQIHEIWPMFTGIVECLGKIKHIEQQQDNRRFLIESAISQTLRVDQSVSHDGVCLTVESVEATCHSVTAIRETLAKTRLGEWNTGDLINLERCVSLQGRLDGHLVQGHVDATATCKSVTETGGSWLLTFQINQQFAPLIIEKGSVCINGISLTVFDVGIDRFSVAIIPYTYEQTNIGHVQAGSTVNIEFDVLGKYVQRNLSLLNKEH
jgi:riboflavin synthase